MRTLEAIVIDPRVRDDSLARKVLERPHSIPIRFESPEQVRAGYAGLSLRSGKKILFLTRNKGALVKPCPATRTPYLCCRYHVVNQMLHCPMDCSYCILQEYLDVPVITAFTNIQDIFGQIDRLMAEHPGRFFRFGTGELADSLALDPFLELSAEWIRFFSGKRNALIELKTKSDAIETLPPGGGSNAVISWSLNPPNVILHEERGAASLGARMRAAVKCQDHYLLGFHFDPLLWTEGWRSEYDGVIRRLSGLDAGRIAWISLGTLRFPPALKETVIRRFPRSRLVFQEMIRGADGKMRYPRPKRIEIYRAVYERLKSWAPDLFIYFCMESPEVWERVTGWSPNSNADLDYRFACSLFERFPDLPMDRPESKAYEE